MKYLHLLSSMFWLTVLVVACNTRPADSEKNQENFDKKSESAETKIEGEKFPDGGGFKGRHNDRVFYVEVKESGVTGFVRYKDSNKENKVEGAKSTPYDFECEELNEDDEVIAKIRGKLSNDELSAESEYTEENSSKTFRFQLER